VKAGKLDPRRLVLIDSELYYLDLRFRMLENIELARAMGFTDAESTYEFIGNKTEVTKQIGNAVPVNLSKDMVKVILE
jgi:DNA (cytosine-5)-methyltransferase 1